MNWPVVALGEVAEIERGGVAPERIETGTEYLGLEHIESGGEIVSRQTVEAGELASTKFVFDSRHLLYGKLRPYLAKIALPDFEGVCSTDILPVMPGRNLDRRYLAYFLRQPSMVEFARNRSTGANLPRLSPKELAQFSIPLPPLKEQKRIAGILDQAAQLCRFRTRALDTLNTLGQAIFHEMFVANSSPDWPTVPIEQITDNMRTGPFGSQLLHSEFVEKGIPVLGIDNAVSNEFRWAKERYISSEKYEQLKRYTVLPGDVLVTIMGTCGRCAVVPEDIPTAINTKHLCCLTLDQERVDPYFLQAALLSHPNVLRQLGIEAKGAVMPGMNMGIIKALKVPLPPVELQHNYAGRLGVIKKSRSQAQIANQAIETLFASLQHRAFRGEL
ncbi:restriction endonuclease subunit S [Salipiger sp.]|uniref:restriction endonuclease subunit S n=1 Tax=Salipiger sp. TaxID=2078585 RepID=UPI003A96B891